MYQWIYITVHLYSNNVSKWATYPACFGIIYKHIYNNVYPFVLPKMAPFCTKITIIFLGEDPQSPLLSWLFYILLCYICIHINNQTKFNHTSAQFTNTLSAKKSHEKSCPASLLNQHSDPSPLPPFWFFFCCCCAFQKKKIVGENKYSGLGIVKINFPAVLMLKINNLSRQNLPALPPPLRTKWSSPYISQRLHNGPNL